MQLDVRRESWPLRTAFSISRGTKTEADVVVVTLDGDGVVGRGECVPYKRYGETLDGVCAAVEAMAGPLREGLDRAGLLDAMPPGAARNAIDCALWDMEAKRAGRRAWQIAGLDEPRPSVTAYTIGVGDSQKMAADAAANAHRALLKLKLTGPGDLTRVAAVREVAPDARIVVDANEAWSADMCSELLPALRDLGVEMVEQPLPADADDALADIDRVVPICADESCHTRDDLHRLEGRYDMVNIKLDKSGGLTEALALAGSAEARGFGLMVGCMVATSLAMAPATLLMNRACLVDLDGPLLLREDRENGLSFADGMVHPPASALWG